MSSVYDSSGIRLSQPATMDLHELESFVAEDAAASNRRRFDIEMNTLPETRPAKISSSKRAARQPWHLRVRGLNGRATYTAPGDDSATVQAYSRASHGPGTRFWGVSVSPAAFWCIVLLLLFLLGGVIVFAVLHKQMPKPLLDAWFGPADEGNV